MLAAPAGRFTQEGREPAASKVGRGVEDGRRGLLELCCEWTRRAALRAVQVVPVSGSGAIGSLWPLSRGSRPVSSAERPTVDLDEVGDRQGEQEAVSQMLLAPAGTRPHTLSEVGVRIHHWFLQRCISLHEIDRVHVSCLICIVLLILYHLLHHQTRTLHFDAREFF